MNPTRLGFVVILGLVLASVFLTGCDSLRTDGPSPKPWGGDSTFQSSGPLGMTHPR